MELEPCLMFYSDPYPTTTAGPGGSKLVQRRLVKIYSPGTAAATALFDAAVESEGLPRCSISAYLVEGPGGEVVSEGWMSLVLDRKQWRDGPLLFIMLLVLCLTRDGCPSGCPS